MWFSMLLVLVSVAILFSSSICLDDIKLCLHSLVAIFWERAARFVNLMFSLL